MAASSAAAGPEVRPIDLFVNKFRVFQTNASLELDRETVYSCPLEASLHRGYRDEFQTAKDVHAQMEVGKLYRVFICHNFKGLVMDYVGVASVSSSAAITWSTLIRV